MAVTTYYCVRQDVLDRISASGANLIANDRGDGEPTEAELVRSIDGPIRDAASQVDAALQFTVELPYSQSTDALNAFLRPIATDLATERAFERRGIPVPQSLRTAADRARATLKELRLGIQKVPLLAYPGETDAVDLRRIGKPRTANPTPPNRQMDWDAKL